MRKIKALLGTVVVAAGLGLVTALPAHADSVGPVVHFDTGLHFVKGSMLSDSTTRAKLNVSAKWTQGDTDGICSESGYGYDSYTGQYSNWSGVRTSYPFPVTAGYEAYVQVQATDCAGNTSTYYEYPTWTLFQEASVSYNGTWQTSSCGCFSEGAVKYSTQVGASASFTANATNFGLVTDRASNRGTADVYVDGVKKATINEQSSITKNRVVDFSYYTPYTGYHTIKVVVRSGRIDIDAFVTS